MKVTYGVKVQAIENEKECGDQYCIKEEADSLLIAVADGLGHGEEAAFAAKIAMRIINIGTEKHLGKLINTCHEALKLTRGSALMVAHIIDSKVSWAGIGNVMGIHYQTDFLRKDNPYLLLSQPGIVGYNSPIVQISTFNLEPNDTLIFFTDGILEKFISSFSITPHASPQDIADFIFKNYRNPRDDSLVLVVRLT